jgi:histidine ammonia-lyase
VREQVERELAAHQSNPLVVVDEERLVSVGNFEVAALATALDLPGSCSRRCSRARRAGPEASSRRR